MHGETLLHSAFDNGLYDLLLQMIDHGGDGLITDNYNETVNGQIKGRHLTTSNETEKEKLYQVLCKIHENLNYEIEKHRVWNEPPLHWAVSKNKMSLLCFMNALGVNFTNIYDLFFIHKYFVKLFSNYSLYL